MLADAERPPPLNTEVRAGNVGGSTASLPRNFRSSVLLRRRKEGLGPKVANCSARLSMPAEMCDFIDHQSSGQAPMAMAAAHELVESQASMLHALLSNLPEPPSGIMDTMSDLADELPVPPLSPTPLSPPTVSPDHRLMAAVAAVATDDGSQTVAEQSLAVTALETPESSRRNTGEVPLSREHRRELQGIDCSRASSPALSLLGGEMPPESPFFAQVSPDDITRTRESIRRAKTLRSRSLRCSRRTATWCVTDSTEPLFASLRPENHTPARASLAGILDGWEKTLALDANGDDGWLGDTTPPTSPFLSAKDADRTLSAPADNGDCKRWFRVNVHSFFSPLFAHSTQQRVTVEELSDSCSTASSTTMIDDDPEVQAALARHSSVLPTKKTPKTKPTTLMRKPTQLGAKKERLGTGKGPRQPSLSFVVGNGPREKADRFAQSADIEAMVEAYLPRVHARFCAMVDRDDGADSDSGARQRTASETSTLAEAGCVQSVYAESNQSASSEETLSLPRRALPGPQMLRLRKSATGPAGGPPGQATRQLRPSASTASLKPSTLATQRARRVHTVSQIAAPATVASRRRSEVQALLSQANAVMSTTRRRSALERTPTQPLPPQSQPSPRVGGQWQQRPPRSSLPLTSGMRRMNSIVISPRSSLDGPPPHNVRSSVLSDSGIPSRIAPPTSLTAALTRNQHRLEAKGSRLAEPGEISPLALTPVYKSRSLGPENIRKSRSLGRQSTLKGKSETCSPATPVSRHRSGRMSISLSGLRPPNSGSRIPVASPQPPATPNIARRPPLRPAAYSTPHSASMIGMPGGLRRLGSSAMLRSHTVGYSGMSDSDSDESQLFPAPGTERRTPLMLRPSSRRSDIDDEFLTLRPVHTPDIVPRTIDPRLVERAMTPMLKTNLGLHKKSNLSQQAQQSSDSDDSDGPVTPTHAPLSDNACRLSTVLEVSSVAELQPPSRMSPIASPPISPDLRSISTESARKFVRPGFLARRWTRHSNVPVTPSSIPMPPVPADKPQPKKPSSSRIPSLRKARSLWSLRGLQSK
ncbi:hypothetical protein GGF46_004517 [Coemansia sp. RSA 552]|nr:hypothetical protein GGF46_004517 [Coemansia sp. RSA 552]